MSIGAAFALRLVPAFVDNNEYELEEESLPDLPSDNEDSEISETEISETESELEGPEEDVNQSGELLPKIREAYETDEQAQGLIQAIETS